MRYFNLLPKPADQPAPTETITETEPPAPVAPNTSPAPTVSAKKPTPAVATQTPSAPTTQVAAREIKITTPTWEIKLSNRGAVVTSWIITKHDGTPIYAAGGNGKEPLELIPQDALETIGAPLRLRLPDAPLLAQELNQANYQVEGATDCPRGFRL